ncbi:MULTISPECIES: fused MFS/spermidine synthase [unclassified Solwaraspora]|uniref:fused MFS/spermidine synthase n=1 Tax=unclassified Solwaraspora TaxID=2627926 RepID=UPI00248C6183|nr:MULTISPECIES: fused MFS/spermidine synthase [unclassified Solwaraspora]WBB96424.1 fused MFS/spermidine synthase [Solwaraspora sp. WMMA2059]WBC19669.1 fused MFS/spermidine synthase [Solwaraspora sp. WMMA2080]WJK32750.1 fused MFS/spermidine synthase [Solwaraspora sp. WMMA2065]
MDSPPPDTPLRPGLAAALVFVSSGAVLVLEIVALRLVGPYIGVTLQTNSAVIGVALAAIAYGTWIGGRIADRRDPRPLLPAALVLAGITTAITLPLVRYAGELLRGSAVVGILLLTMVAIVLPAALLSAVTPLVIKLQLGDLNRTGEVVGKLSSIGTLGAITATLGTGFFLVATLPSSVIMMTLALLLGGSGIALGVYLHRTRPPTDATATATGGGADGGAAPGGRTGTATRSAVAVIGLLAVGLAVAAPDPCDVETEYHCATVQADPDRGSGRLLLLNSARHSYVDLDDPTHLEFAYTRWIGAALDVTAPPGEPLDALHLGGGGFTMPRYLSATRPGTRNTVYEIDGGLVDLGVRELDVQPGPDLAVVVGDARILVTDLPTDSVDVVVGDAFGHLVVPWHLATREMAAEIRRVVRPGGSYLQNVIDYPPLRFIQAEVATVAAEFPEVALITRPGAATRLSGSNFVILAADRPLPLDEVRARLTASVGAEFDLLAGDELTDFVAGAQPLTDDYAPVDQLLVAP